jgi:hypothetical protein
VNTFTELTVCASTVSATVTEEARINEAYACTSSTGLEFEFTFNLEGSFDYGTPSPGFACLVGSASLTLPSEDVYSTTFESGTSCESFIVDYRDSVYAYDFYFLFQWRLSVETPTGTVPYAVYFTGYR